MVYAIIPIVLRWCLCVKLKKVLLSCAIFVVVSLCSFTVAYANVTGQVESIIPYNIYTSTVGGSTVTTTTSYKYDFPITGDSVLFDLAQYTKFGLTPPAEIPIDIYFDEPLPATTNHLWLNLTASGSVRYPDITGFHLHRSTGATSIGNSSNIHKNSGYSSTTTWSGYLSWTSVSDVIGITIYVTPTYYSTSTSAIGKLSSRFAYVYNDSSDFDDIISILNDIKTDTGNLDDILSLLLAMQSTQIQMSDSLSSLVDYIVDYPYTVNESPVSRYNPLILDVTYDEMLVFMQGLSSKLSSTGFYRHSISGSNSFIDRSYIFTIRDVTINPSGTIYPLLCIRSFNLSGGSASYPFCLYLEDLDKVILFRVVYPDVEQGTEMQGQLDDATGEAQDALDAQEELESQFQGSMTSNFNALNVSSFSFDSDAQSGLTLAGNVFTSIYNAFGKWSILYSFPLLLGVVLLLIGKISKTAGRSSSKGKGDDE